MASDGNPHRNQTPRHLLLAAVALALFSGIQTRADDAAPRLLFGPGSPQSGAQVAPNGSGDDVSLAVSDGSIDVTVVANGKSGYPGVMLKPSGAFDASGFGHAEATVTNEGTKPIRVNLRVDNDGPWQDNRYSAAVVTIKPGETKIVPAIFGYQYGKKGFAVDPAKLSQILIFVGKSDTPQKFKIEKIQAAGPAGETPAVDASTVSVKPKGGMIFGPGAAIDAKNLAPAAGAKAALSGNTLKIEFSGADQSVNIKPVAGTWNLNQHLQVRVRIKNVGKGPATPNVQLASRGGKGSIQPAASAIAVGGETEIVVPFMAVTPWQGVDDPTMRDGSAPAKEYGEELPGTGTDFKSNVTTAITISPDKKLGAQSYEITSVVADMPPQPKLPEWLGQRPPVDGDWKQTFNDDFNGSAIDLKTWNIYTEGEWHLGKDTAFSKDNVIVKDGKLALRVEKRKAHHNDNPQYKQHEYATGNADTYGKWTQRYGYFESRMKLPTAPNMFTAFWMMPDRGIDWDPNQRMIHGFPSGRNDTKDGGMEFDIMEQLSIWGPNRHDFGMHWDGYFKYHKSTGVFTCYFQPDAEGYVTVGMLWVPGEVVMYQNGNVAARWKTDRIGSRQAYFILQNITGGWETEGFDDATLPADMVFDYVRAWQRADLATPEDGPKPNDGGPLAPKK